MGKINHQKEKYQNLVILLSDFIDQLINEDPNIVNNA